MTDLTTPQQIISKLKEATQRYKTLTRERSQGVVEEMFSRQNPIRPIKTSELASAGVQLASLLPADIDAVVGVPRSGMLPAGIVAVHLHLPLYAAKNGRIENCGSGYRMNGGTQTKPKHAVLIDDTVMFGIDSIKPVDGIPGLVVYSVSLITYDE